MKVFFVDLLFVFTDSERYALFYVSFENFCFWLFFFVGGDNGAYQCTFACTVSAFNKYSFSGSHHKTYLVEKGVIIS